MIERQDAKAIAVVRADVHAVSRGLFSGTGGSLHPLAKLFRVGGVAGVFGSLAGCGSFLSVARASFLS